MRIVNVMDVSLDGKIAVQHLQNDAGRRAHGFGGDADRALVLREIAHADAIITGANSVRAAGGVWDALGKDHKYPAWFILTNEGLSPDLLFWKQSHIPRYLVSSTPAVNGQLGGVKNLCYGDQPPATYLFEQLKRLKAERVLIFGGGFVNQIFYEAGLVDELKITISPVIVGRKDAPQFVVPELSRPTQLKLLSSQTVDNHLFLHYSIQKI